MDEYLSGMSEISIASQEKGNSNQLIQLDGGYDFRLKPKNKKAVPLLQPIYVYWLEFDNRQWSSALELLFKMNTNKIGGVHWNSWSNSLIFRSNSFIFNSW